MPTRPITAHASRVMVEQLVASGVKYVFYNSGSREARFFDSLHANPDIEGILSLHEGIVTAAAGGYTQVKGDPGVMVVHLGAGLAQCLGQLINVWSGSLPVVVVTVAGETGRFADRIALDRSPTLGPPVPDSPRRLAARRRVLAPSMLRGPQFPRLAARPGPPHRHGRRVSWRRRRLS